MICAKQMRRRLARRRGIFFGVVEKRLNKARNLGLIKKLFSLDFGRSESKERIALIRLKI